MRTEPGANQVGGVGSSEVGSRAAPYGIVGDGRMARHMSHYLDLLGLVVETWSRNSSIVAPADGLAACPVVLLLVADDALESVAETFPAHRRPILVHFSGRVVSPRASGMHPLSTFGPDLYDLATYGAISFVTDRGGVPFPRVFPRLPNPHYDIDPDLKPLYHSLAVLAGNFTTALWQKLFATFPDRLGLPAEAAFPYLRQIAQNLERDSAGALTGPIARGDRRTIQNNLDALDGDPYHAVYVAFVHALAPDLLIESS